MGIARFLKGIIDPKVSGENIILTFEKAYRKAKELYPGAEPHILLCQACLSRMATHFKNPYGEETKQEAMKITAPYACIPPPKNIRALAIHFIKMERPDIIQSYPEFVEEFEELMRPVEVAIQRDELLVLYQQYNPTVSQQLE